MVIVRFVPSGFPLSKLYQNEITLSLGCRQQAAALCT